MLGVAACAGDAGVWRGGVLCGAEADAQTAAELGRPNLPLL